MQLWERSLLSLITRSTAHFFVSLGIQIENMTNTPTLTKTNLANFPPTSQASENKMLLKFSLWPPEAREGHLRQKGKDVITVWDFSIYFYQNNLNLRYGFVD